MRARCPCPGAGGRRRCRTHAGALLTAARRSTCRATLLLPPTGVPSDRRQTATCPRKEGPRCPCLFPTPCRYDGVSGARGTETAAGVSTRDARLALLPAPPPPPIALCSAAPLRPSRAARRRDGCRGGDCVIVCVCIVCGATRAMRATRARGASTEPVECRKCSRRHRPHLADAVAHDLEDAGHHRKRRVEHDKLHQLRVDVLNVPSRVQRASAGCPS